MCLGKKDDFVLQCVIKNGFNVDGYTMGMFDRYMDSAQHKWNWYMCTLAGSMIPMAMRFFISLDCEINMFDIKDLLFAGLTMNLSNLNLVGNNRFKQRDRIAVLSGFFIVFISVALGVFFIDENPGIKKPFLWSKIMSVGVVIGSVCISYKTNEFIYSNTKK